MNQPMPRWIQEIHQDIIIPRRNVITNHPFILAMQAGVVEKKDAERFFSGLMWHLMDFGKHVEHLMKKRPKEVETFLAGRSEDKDGNTDILARIVTAFGGPIETIINQPWEYRPHQVWNTHDSLLRAAIYSTDHEWQVGTAALNMGIESLVPTMIEPLFHACVTKYGVSQNQAEWLESRAGEEEKQHGENAYLVLAEFVNPEDKALISKCRYYIDMLSYSMAYRLLLSGQKGPLY